MTAGGIYVICIWCHVYFRVVKLNLKLGNKHEHHFAQINQLLLGFFENKHRVVIQYLSGMLSFNYPLPWAAPFKPRYAQKCVLGPKCPNMVIPPQAPQKLKNM